MKYKLLIEYEGSRYAGWQVHAGKKTIQGLLLAAAEKVFETPHIELQGAGRTDAGVHALGQVAHLEAESPLPADLIHRRLNHHLPNDIHVRSLEPCAPSFHARHDAVARSYIYQVSTRRAAFGHEFVWSVREELDVEKMNEAAASLKGFHNFAAFSHDPKKEKDTRVNMQVAQWHERGSMLLLHVCASHFLWRMVRRLTGVMVAVGKGELPQESVQQWLQQPSPDPGKYSAPSAGLFLERVYYPGEKIETEPQALLDIR